MFGPALFNACAVLYAWHHWESVNHEKSKSPFFTFNAILLPHPTPKSKESRFDTKMFPHRKHVFHPRSVQTFLYNFVYWNDIEVYEESVPRTKKISHYAVNFKTGEEDRIVHGSSYWVFGTRDQKSLQRFYWVVLFLTFCRLQVRLFLGFGHPDDHSARRRSGVDVHRLQKSGFLNNT